MMMKPFFSILFLAVLPLSGCAPRRAGNETAVLGKSIAVAQADTQEIADDVRDAIRILSPLDGKAEVVKQFLRERRK